MMFTKMFLFRELFCLLIAGIGIKHVVLAAKQMPDTTKQEEHLAFKKNLKDFDGGMPSFRDLLHLDAELYRRVNASLYADYNGTHNFNDTYEYDEYGGPNDMNGGGCHGSQPRIVKLITMVLYALVCIIGLFGNTLVIYVVLRFSKMQTVTNIYILNLAIADECFLIGIPFLLYTMHTNSWKFGEYMCKAYMVSTSITQFTSSIFLLIMSADRYIAVCHPISSPRYRTPFVSKVVSAIAWMTSVLLMLPVILFASTVPNGKHLSCNIIWPEAQNTQSGTTFILYTLALGFATPLTFILVFYCFVIRKLHTVGPKHKSKEKKRSHRKVTKLVLTVITVYILCWLPHWISQVALISSPPSKCASRLEVTIFLLAGCLGYSNSAMNPILYAFLSDNFKKSFMKACTCAARNDINAQLQMENSMFPKFGKNRQSERLFKNKANRKRLSMLGRPNTTNTTTTTTTTTAATVAGAGCMTGATLLPRDGASTAGGGTGPCLSVPGITYIEHSVESITAQPTPTMVRLSISTPSDINASGILVETGEHIDDINSTAVDISGKPPILHTDL